MQMYNTSLQPVSHLVFPSDLAQCGHMRAILLTLLLGAPSWTGDASGIWKVNPIRSTDPCPKSVTVRFEPHAKGEVFTLDSIDADGRTTTSSTILYLDSKPRDFQDLGCSGTQWSRRVDSRTVEILRKCASAEWTRWCGD